MFVSGGKSGDREVSRYIAVDKRVIGLWGFRGWVRVRFLGRSFRIKVNLYRLSRF